MNRIGKPLNGEKTHPLSEHALRVLRRIEGAPVPRYLINPGVRDRLLRESLVEEHMPQNSKHVHFAITDAGRKALR